MIEKYALISVSDKQGIVEFSRILVSLGYKIISTGGTAKILKEHDIPVIPIQEITGNPESFDGRMKTISFQIESGILFDRSNPSHVKQAKELQIKPIDIVVCNLYPFEHTIKNANVSLEEAIENIDVGGPTMIRAAAKNYMHVWVVVDPRDYESLGEFLKTLEVRGWNVENEVGSLPAGRQGWKKEIMKLRKKLAAKAFAHLSFYDSQIAHYLRDDLTCLPAGGFPNEITLPGRKLFDLRYGENPHQKAAAYIRPGFQSSLQNVQRKWGRELSLINITDINAGIESVRLFKEPAAVVIKHNNPSGIALGQTLDGALARAIEADPESAFGGIIVLNSAIDMKTAKIIADFKEDQLGNIDIVASPVIDLDSFEFLKNIRKSMGIYTFGEIPETFDPFTIKWIDGGFVLQTNDLHIEDSFQNWKVVTKKQPTKQQMRQVQIAWKFVSRIKSNSVIIVDEQIPMTRGIGSGQTSRVRSTKIALEQAGAFAKGGILASDSFFPFGDSVKLAAEKGIVAIIQQGGSIRDQESIDEANKAEIVMVFTGRRAFWH